MLQYKTFTQQKKDFPPPPADDWLDRVRSQNRRYLRRYNPMGPKDLHKKREITKLKSTQSAMSQLDATLNKFVTRQPRSFGIDVVERNNLNYTYHKVKGTPARRTSIIHTSPPGMPTLVSVPSPPLRPAFISATTPPPTRPTFISAPAPPIPIVVDDVEEKEPEKDPGTVKKGGRSSSGWHVLDLSTIGDSSRQLISTAVTRRTKSRLRRRGTTAALTPTQLPRIGIRAPLREHPVGDLLFYPHRQDKPNWDVPENVSQYAGRTVDEFETDYRFLVERLLESGGLRLNKSGSIRVNYKGLDQHEVWLLDRFGFVLPGDEETIEELQRVEKLLEVMENMTPDLKYLEAQTSHYRSMWLKMMRGERMTPNECVVLQSMNYEPPPNLEIGDVPNAEEWLDYMTRVQHEVQPWVEPEQPVSLFAEFEDAAAVDGKTEEEKQEEKKQEEQQSKHSWLHWSNWDPNFGILGPALFPNAFKTEPKRPKHRHSGSGLLAKASTGIRPVSTTNPDSTPVTAEAGMEEQKENNDASTGLDAKMDASLADDLPPPPITQFNTNPALQYY